MGGFLVVIMLVVSIILAVVAGIDMDEKKYGGVILFGLSSLIVGIFSSALAIFFQ